MTADTAAPEEKIAFPENEEELDALLREATQLQAKVDGFEATRTRRKAAIDAETKAKIAPLQERIDRLMNVATPYIKANRVHLTGDLKSFETSSTTVKFQDDGTGTLAVADEDVPGVIAALEKKKGGKAFIEIKKSLKKDVLKKWLLGGARRKVSGVKVVFNDRMLVQGKISQEQKRRGVKPPVLRRELEQRTIG